MSKALRVPEYLEHILSAIKRIERHVTDVDEFGFLQSELLQDAVVRNIEVIGEAANNIQRVDPNFANAHADVPWQVMYAMRNRLLELTTLVHIRLSSTRNRWRRQ